MPVSRRHGHKRLRDQPQRRRSSRTCIGLVKRAPSGPQQGAKTLRTSAHKVTPSGTVTLLHGPAIGLVNARGIGIDDKGNLYVNENIVIVRIAATGCTVTTYQLPATQEGGFLSAASVAVNEESGVVYFTDSAKHTVSQLSVDGKNSIIAGRTGEVGAVDVEK